MAYFVELLGQGGLFHLAYGTLARKQVDIQRQFFYAVVEITCLPASWQNLLEKMFPAIDARWMLSCAPRVMLRLSMVIVGLVAIWMPICYE